MLSKDPRTLVMTVSLAASVVMLAGKLTAYAITGSAAILADAAESVVHGVATGFAAFSLWYAARPADAEHPYGHGRIAYFSAGFEGALVCAASVAVISAGVRGLIWGVELRRLGVGFAISAVLAAINLVLGLALIRTGRKHRSMILVANGEHVLSDMWTTAAAIVGVGLVMLTGWEPLDPITALLIGCVILFTGWKLVAGAVSGLMDRVEPGLTDKLLCELRAAVGDGTIADFHQLRCRRLNDAIWVEVHMLVPGRLTTTAAHERVTKVESRLSEALGGETVHITTHIEPQDHAAAHPDGHPEINDALGSA